MASVAVLTVTEGIVSNIAAKALEQLAKVISVKISSWRSPRNDLKKLDEKMKFIQARIRDAESRQEGENSEAIKLWLHKLKMVLYRAEDLFEEVIAIDRQNQQDQQRMKESKLGKVGLLFSKAGPLSLNKRLASEIKSIKEELDEIESIMVGLGLRANFVQPSEPTHFTMNRETASYVDVEDIVGRENDKKKIIDLLFDPKFDGEKLTVIPIVGLGGLGKTALAQLLYNDKVVQNHFSLRKWVCTPEVDNLSAVRRKVYRCLTGKNSADTPLDDIKSGIKSVIKEKKYLLVLDDIWDENHDDWLDLKSLLECGGGGSKVIVTTRSDIVAEVVGTIPKAYKLGFLTDDDSWDLFTRLAFKQNQGPQNPSLIKIGREIVKSCGNVPLAIRVVGSLLYTKCSEIEWRLFREDQLSKAKQMKDNKVMSALKLSYDYLQPELKRCFAYCSLFPKDYLYSKDDLVCLWMAHGYVDPSSTYRAELYFIHLLERNLLQDPKKDDQGNIVRCKMHDLVHDLAQLVAGDETKHLDDPSVQINNEVIHVSFNVPADECEVPPGLLNAPNMRSLFIFGDFLSIKASSMEQVVSNCKSLRALQLNNVSINMIPDSIEKLIHLRYLNLASTDVECLPDAITRLGTLQTLNLCDCKWLKQLPKGFGKLANLRHLFIGGSGLTDFPPGFGKLASLEVLDMFPVGESSGIDSLPALNLLGKIQIRFYKCRNDAVLEAERATLKSNGYLTSLTLDLNRRAEKEMDRMLERLELPPNLEYLRVLEHGGYAMPVMPRSWLDELRKLVSITISDCSNCNALPHFSQLPGLKNLSLCNLPSLEYVEDENDVGVGDADFYFPYLEVLELGCLGELKGWTRPSYVDGVPRQLLFPRLSKLEVCHCQKLMSMPLAPELESLDTKYFNGNLLKPYMKLVDQGEASSSPLVTPCSTLFPSLKTMWIYRANELISLPISNRLCSLESLIIRDVYQLMSLTLESPTSIRDLKIFNCKRLRNLSVGNLCALETLEIHRSAEAITITGWEGLKSIRLLSLSDINSLMELPQQIACLTTLQHLEIKRLPNLIELPQEMGNLSLLRELQIEECPNLTSLPPSLLGLTSLHTLRIVNCPELQKRYQKPNGEDCHLLQHVAKVSIVVVTKNG